MNNEIKRLIPKPIRDARKEVLLNIKFKDLKTRDHSKLLIIGCGRSGTTYVSKYFAELGIDIAHERLGQDGMVAWWLTSEQKRSNQGGPSTKELKDFNIPMVHQVREPLAAISSLQTMSDASVIYASKEIPIDYEKDSPILRSMKYWYYWNKLSQEKAQKTYQLEKLDSEIEELLEIGKFTVANFKVPEVPKTTNSRKHYKSHAKLTWEDLEKEDKELTAKIKELAISYGYSI